MENNWEILKQLKMKKGCNASYTLIYSKVFDVVAIMILFNNCRALPNGTEKLSFFKSRIPQNKFQRKQKTIPSPRDGLKDDCYYICVC